MSVLIAFSVAPSGGGDSVSEAVEAASAGSARVSLVLKADIREGVTDALTAKVEAVERHLRP